MQVSVKATGDADQETFTIRHAVREFNVTSRTLRFYEEKGLLRPRRVGQERLYTRRDRARLKYILMGKAVGFSLDEIREMLDLYDLGDRQIPQLDNTLRKVRDRITRLETQKVDLDRAIAELTHAARMIEGMITTRQAPSRARAG